MRRAMSKKMGAIERQLSADERPAEGFAPGGSLLLTDQSDSTTETAAFKRKRHDYDDDGAHAFPPEELSKMSRSERKRHREKKRRSDVNRGFDELTAVLLEVDPEVRAEADERARRGLWKGTVGVQEENLLSRVDLIGRTVTVIKRLHRENEERKQIIATLTKIAADSGSMLVRRRPNEEAGLMLPPSLPQNADELIALRAAAAERAIAHARIRMEQTRSFRSNVLAQAALSQRLPASIVNQPRLHELASSLSTPTSDLLGQLGSGLSANSSLLAELQGAGFQARGTSALTHNYMQLLQGGQQTPQITNRPELTGLYNTSSSPRNQMQHPRQTERRGR